MMGVQERNEVTTSAVAAPLLTFVVFVVLYAAMLPSGLRGADSTEFATLMGASGVAHPPGYPLYTWLLRAFAWLPFEELHRAAAFVTALCGAAACVLVAAATRALGASGLAAFSTSVVVGTHSCVMSLHTHAEVFALNNLIGSAIVYAAVRPLGSAERQLGLLGVLAGLGLANHHSIVLLAPIGLYAAGAALRRSKRRLIALASVAACFAIGVAPYVAMYVSWGGCDSCLSWGDGGSADALWRHVSRADYGTTSLGVGGARDPVAHLLAYLRATVWEQWALAAVLAAGGVVRGWRTHRGMVVALVASVMLAGPFFVMLFNVELTPIGESIVARFYALSIVVAAPLVAFALRGATPRAVVLVLVCASLIAAGNIVRLADGDHTVIDDYITDTLTPLPQDAVVLSTGDHRYFGAMYTQLIRGARPDVVWVDARLLAYGWYSDRVARRLEVELPRSTESSIPIIDIVAKLQATGRAVFLTHMFTDHLKSVPSYPYGTTIRLLRAGERPPAPRELAAVNVELYDRFTVTPGSTNDPWAVDLMMSYERTWRSLGDALRATGDVEGAHNADAMADVYAEQ